MNTSNDERFHDLAHKALGKEAQPVEQAELQALIAKDPGLKEEFEQLGAESTTAREMLMLMEDVEHPQGPVPAIPVDRLKQQVARAFAQRQPPEGELVELLDRLEKWVARKFGEEQERLIELISFLRQSSGSVCESVSVEVGMPSSLFFQSSSAPRLREEAEARATREQAEEIKGREIEFEDRLRSLEARIRRAEDIAHECRNEVQGLLKAFTQERETGRERRRQNPKSAKPE